MNKMNATKKIPDGMEIKIKNWLCRIFGWSTCYGLVLSIRDEGVDNAIYSGNTHEDKVAKALEILTDRESCINECVAEWRSNNPQADCGIMFRLHGFSVAQTAFHMRFGFLPYIADLKRIFGEIFDTDEERLEAIELLK